MLTMVLAPVTREWAAINNHDVSKDASAKLNPAQAPK
jgi:hypothetical protein